MTQHLSTPYFSFSLNDNEQKVSSNAIIVSLKKQIEALQEELKNSSDSSLQVCTILRNYINQDFVLTYST